MTDLTTLRDLDALLERATGPDRELDCSVCEALGITGRMEPAEGSAAGRRSVVFVVRLGGMQYTGYPHITESLDAALALVERAYPSLVIHMTRIADGGIQVTSWHDAEDDSIGHDDAAPPADGGIAIVRVLVAALIARAKSMDGAL